MTFLSATKARQNFFKLLDRAARGETIVIEREGIPLKLVRTSRPKSQKRTGSRRIDYTRFIRTPVDNADSWGWSWSAAGNLGFSETKRSS